MTKAKNELEVIEDSLSELDNELKITIIVRDNDSKERVCRLKRVIDSDELFDYLGLQTIKETKQSLLDYIKDAEEEGDEDNDTDDEEDDDTDDEE